MKRIVTFTLLSASLTFALAMPVICSAQATPTRFANSSKYHINDFSMGVAAAGQFTDTFTSNIIGSGGQTLPHQATTDSPGVLVTIRDQPFSWAGVEFNYQYTKLSERYVIRSASAPITSAPNFAVNLPTSMHEATGAYVLHLKMKHFKPYAAIGGGAIDFVPTTQGQNQWRATGLADIGADFQTHSNLGFRFGGRGLFYRGPNFMNTALASSRWMATTEPYAGVYVKF